MSRRNHERICTSFIVTLCSVSYPATLRRLMVFLTRQVCFITSLSQLKSFVTNREGRYLPEPILCGKGNQLLWLFLSDSGRNRLLS
jgi:hypothetical protein